jgi:hypothetical protein
MMAERFEESPKDIVGDNAHLMGGEQTAPSRAAKAWTQPLYRAVALAATVACLGAAACGASRLSGNRENIVADPEIVSFASSEDKDNSSGGWIDGFGYVNVSYSRHNYSSGLSVDEGDVLLVGKKQEHHGWYFALKVHPDGDKRGFVPMWAVQTESSKITRAFTAKSSDDHKGCIKKVNIGDAAFLKHEPNHTSGWTWIVAVRSAPITVQKGWVPNWVVDSE